jgi:hypothetical protein
MDQYGEVISGSRHASIRLLPDINGKLYQVPILIRA